MRATFLEAYGDRSNNHQKLMLSFKQMETETIVQAYRRCKKLSCNLEHGLRDYMHLNGFYLGLSQPSRRHLNRESDTHFFFLKTCDAIKVLDGMLADDYIYKSIRYARIRDMYIKENYEAEETTPLSAMYGKETLEPTTDKKIK
jgi:hypothetical protein